MKKYRMLLTCLLVASCGWLAACHSASTTDAETTVPEITVRETTGAETESEPVAGSETEIETETESASESESETEAVDPNVLNLAKLPTNMSAPTTRNVRCKSTIEEDSEAERVLRITTSGISGAGAIPEAYLSLSNIASTLNMEVPSTTAYPYLVLKVRAGNVWSHLMSFHGGESIRNAKPASASDMTRVRLRMTDEWQYVCFDLSGYTADVKTLYMQFEYGAAANGEYLDIAEIRFIATEEEAVSLCGRDAYEVEEADDRLRIISYNIWVGNGTDTTMRADIFRDLIEQYRPDSIGMQEVNRAWLSEFESFAFNESYAGVGEGRDASYEACLIYYRVDKYELVDSGTFWLSDTPDVKGSKFPDSAYPRICTWAHLRDRVTGYEYMHINTHLDHLGKDVGHAVRAEQIKVLLEFVNGLEDLPIVMTGDFNSAAKTGTGEPYKAYAYITGEAFQNAAGETIQSPFADTRLHAAETVPADRTATMTKYFDESDSAYQPDRQPIDYQFYIPAHFEPLSYDTVIWERDGVPVSDHLALICEYRMLTTETQES